MLKEISNSDPTRMATSEELDQLADLEASIAWANIANHPFDSSSEQQADEQD